MKKMIKVSDILSEDSNLRDIVVTLPATIKWSDYQKELKEAEDYSSEMNFKVSSIPKQTGVGKKCYISHNGFLVGYMAITDIVSKDFTCTTTGNKWKGNFIVRSGPFTYLKDKIPMKGFQGFRYIN